MGVGTPKKRGEKYVDKSSSLELYGDSVNLESINSFLEQINGERDKISEDTDYVNVYRRYVEESAATQSNKVK